MSNILLLKTMIEWLLTQKKIVKVSKKQFQMSQFLNLKVEKKKSKEEKKFMDF